MNGFKLGAIPNVSEIQEMNELFSFSTRDHPFIQEILVDPLELSLVQEKLFGAFELWTFNILCQEEMNLPCLSISTLDKSHPIFLGYTADLTGTQIFPMELGKEGKYLHICHTETGILRMS